MKQVLFATINVAYFYIGTFRSTCPLPSMAMFCLSWLLCFPGMLFSYVFSYFPNDFEMVSVALITTGMKFFLHVQHTLYFYRKAKCCSDRS
jgi:hypothetical protein